ncbi:hypothetical protein [Butyrivibrio proteoclasticus]|uniref:hypothetical protein n=1 Tax=Butyrivibrio proteoclasticus TaxID=43305 RepID=UPI00047A2F39|nr:hypothetical protein [Butyrivibrio proteoclasticus]
MIDKIKKCNWTIALTMTFIIVVVCFLINMHFSSRDFYYNESSNAGYINAKEKREDGTKLIAEGLRLNYLYSGQYVITISHSKANPGDYCEVVETKNGEVLATKEYSVDNNSTSVLLELNDRIEGIVVRSYCKEKITIAGYVISSNGKVYTDTHWLRRILILYLCALAFGVWLNKQNRPRFLELLLFSTVCSFPFLTQNLPYGHDIAFHYTRFRGIIEGIRLHQFPVRIDGAFYKGAGYLVDIMYPGGTLYPFAFMSSHGASQLFSFKCLLVFSVFATVFCSYYPLRNIIGDKTAMIFTLIYTLNPFRLSELYTRCALGEYLAMVFLPLAFAGIYELIVGNYRRGFYEAAIGITLVFQSHLISTLFVIFIAIIIFILLLILTRLEVIKDIKRDIAIVSSATATLVINAWYWVPLLDHFNADYCISRFTGKISDSTIYVFEAFMDGFTSYEHQTMPGTSINGGASHSIGMFLLICTCIYIYIRFIRRVELKNYHIYDFSLLLGTLLLFVQLDIFPWKYMEQQGSVIAEAFAKIQFLWRLQMVVTVLFGIVAAGIMRYLLREKKELFWSLTVFVLLTGAWFSRGYLYESASYQADKYTVPQSMLNGDYLDSTIDYDKVGHDLYDGGEIISDGDLIISSKKRDGVGYHFSAKKSDKDAITVVVPVLYSDFYEVKVNGETTYFSMDEDTTFIKIDIASDVSDINVDINYIVPQKYKYTDLLSGMMCVIILIISILVYIKKNISNSGMFVIRKRER